MGKTASMALLALSLLAIHLFHVSGSLWPMYLLSAMGIVHAFAIAFSRGRALGPTAAYVGLVVTGWLVWVLLDWSRFQQSAIGEPLLRLRDWIQDNPVPIVLAVVGGSTLWMFLLGNATALYGLHQTARVYLAVGTFVLCMWGGWGLLIQQSVVPAWLVQATFIAALVSPLVIIFTHFGLMVSLDSKLLAVTFWTTLLTGYFALARPLVNMVEFFLRELLPQLVGRARLNEFDDLWVLKYTDWMSQISLVLQSVALLSLVAASLARTVDKFEGRVPIWYADWKANRSARAVNAFTVVVQAPLEWAMALANLATNLAFMIIEFVRSLIHNVIQMVKEIPLFVVQVLRLLVIPVATFAVISFAFLSALRDLRVYVLQTTEATHILPNATSGVSSTVYGVRTLWGESVTVVLLALLIGAISFVIANPKFRNEGLAAICVVVLGYLGTTGVGSALAFMLTSMNGRLALPFYFEEYGELLWTNMVLVILLVALVVVTSVPTAFGNARAATSGLGVMNLATFLVILPLLGFSVYALFLGLGPLLSTVRSVSGP